MTKENMIAQLLEKDFNYKIADSLTNHVFEEYELPNLLLARAAFYGVFMGFGFYEGEEASKMAQTLLYDFSSFELSQIIRAVLPNDFVDYYEELFTQEYLSRSTWLSDALIEVLKAVEDEANDLEELVETLAEVIGEEDLEEKKKDISKTQA